MIILIMYKLCSIKTSTTPDFLYAFFASSRPGKCSLQTVTAKALNYKTTDVSLSFSIIIVTWNAAEHLRTFLPSVTKTRHPDYEILIADNGSTDDSREWVQTHHPECRIIQLDRNYGRSEERRCRERGG